MIVYVPSQQSLFGVDESVHQRLAHMLTHLVVNDFLYQHILLRKLLNCFNVCLHLLEIPVHKFTSSHATLLCVCGDEERKSEEGEGGRGGREGDVYMWDKSA